MAATPCATCLYRWPGTYVHVVAAVRVAVFHVAPRVEAAAARAVLSVVIVVPVGAIDGPLRFDVARLRFFLFGIRKWGLDAATDVPCNLMPCNVVFVAAVVAAFDFLCAGAGVDAGEGAFLDAARWDTSCCCCLVLRVAAVVADVSVAAFAVLATVHLEVWAGNLECDN